MVKGVPLYYDALNNDYDDDIKDWFEKNAIPNQKTDIAIVILGYNMKEV